MCLTGDTASSIGKILFDLNANYSSTRAGYLDYLNSDAKFLVSVALGYSTVNSIGDYVKANSGLLNNGTYGLSALYTILTNATYGLSATETLVAAIKAKTDLIPADIATQLDTNVPAIKAKTDLIPADITTALDVTLPALLTGAKGLQYIYDLLDEMPIKLKRIGDTITTDGTEQTLFIYDAPANTLDNIKLHMDLTNMVTTDSIAIKEYYRVKSGGNYILKTTTTFSNAQAPALATFGLECTLFGFKLTITRLASGAGGDKAYDYEVYFEER